MISSPQQHPAEVVTSNFFQRPAISYNDNNHQTVKMQRVLQDALALEKLIQSYDIAQFLNKPSAADDCDLSAITILVGNLSHSLHELVNCAPHGQSIKHTETEPKQSRSPLSSKRCYKCGVAETPRWRRSSSGLPRLCNVCGLLESKRVKRKHSGSKAPSVSTRFSWPC